ncbi:MAG: uracil-DNA glycosylase [Porticoccaceae bacterium]|nr:uracil-DNA glycosylase [Porticoccaceae bacterium]
MADESHRTDCAVPELCGDWRELLRNHMQSDVMRQLMAFLALRRDAGAVIYPPRKYVFAALETTSFAAVRVVIIGQDPYHGPGQAHGLCFSVQPQIAVPPSLRNIYRELADDVGFEDPGHGCLSAWAEQGVLLLNSVLTVEQSAPGAHRGSGWEIFTDQIIDRLNSHSRELIFLLWGNSAHKKALRVDRQRHTVLEAAHPSPLSAYRGFFGCGHFSACNRYLVNTGQVPIDWQLPCDPRAI